MDLVEQLHDEISHLPGIGKRSARRLLFHFLSNKNTEFDRFIRVLSAAREKIISCAICFNYSDTQTCKICSSQRRNSQVLCVVERPQDLFALESTQVFFGQYHVLGGVISPIQGIFPDQLKIKELIERVEVGNFNEIILALNSTVESEATRLYLKERLGVKVKLSELSRGMPAGGELEFVDRSTIQKALEERRIQ